MHPLLTRILYPGWIPRCNHCSKSNKVVEILYGYPSEKGAMDGKKGHVYLGGCVVHDETPRWYCKRCNNKFNKGE